MGANTHVPTTASDKSSETDTAQRVPTQVSFDKETASSANTKPEHLETIRTVSRVPGNPRYYEKDGLRTYGDDEDHEHEPPVSVVSC